MKRIVKIGILALLAMAMLAPATVFAAKKAKGGLIKVGIVNLPPEESGYRQANVEDMNAVFSKANGYDAKQTNTATTASRSPRRRATSATASTISLSRPRTRPVGTTS
jgi:simple sugar transport system substrate-binding protein